MSAAPAHLCTTFRLLRTYKACASGYKKLAEHIRDQHGTAPEDYGLDRAIPIAVVLESNGLADALWSMRATIEPSEQFTRSIACDFAEHVLPLFERRRPDDKRPRQCIEVARRFARGQADRSELVEARRAAAYAYADAAYAYADAAYAYADAAYAYAAAAAADAAAAAAAERDWQTTHFRSALAAASGTGTATSHKDVPEPEATS